MIPSSAPKTTKKDSPETEHSSFNTNPTAEKTKACLQQSQHSHPHKRGEAEQANRLGEKLRKARQQKGLELNEIHQQTKISTNNLKAMEAGEFSKLPAISFCRGLYKIYAKAVDLNPEDIANHFELEYGQQPKEKKRPVFEFGNHNKKIDEMAGRPSLFTFSSIGFILLILLFFGAFLCWFFSWNPAVFLSQQLRSLTPQAHYQTLRSTTDTTTPFTKEMGPLHRTLKQRGKNYKDPHNVTRT